jgi:inositol phosphorylceramide mannosyltransferase catalytic subunit
MKVPKIIHQLWIGEKPIPINALNSVKNMNYDFEYMFWCERTISEKLDIPANYQRKIDGHEEIWGKADLYRWFILEKYGGVFVDADMVSIEPLDDFLLSKGFFSWENETARKNLCATSLQGYPPNHIIPQRAMKWILENNIISQETGIPSWQLVGPGLLSRIYHTLPNKDIVNVFPHYFFLPDHHTGSKYYGHGKVYMTHEWGSTHNTYNEINTMNIPHHHTTPNNSIDIHIPKTTINKQLKDVMKSIKNMEGHFNINIHCENDLSKFIKSMRNVYWKDKIKIFDTRNEMICHYSKKIKKPKVCELGVFKGDFLEFIKDNIDFDILDGVDLFEGNLYSGDVDGNNPVYCQLEKQYIYLNNKYKDNTNINLYKTYTQKYLSQIEDNKYDIIYIDADHSYEGVKRDIILSYKKIKNGGYIMGHDYEMNMNKAHQYYNFGTKRAVDEFCSEYNQKIIAKGNDGCVSFCIQVKK